MTIRRASVILAIAAGIAAFAVLADTGHATPISRQNAVRSARSYLSFTAFSRNGLVEQLRFEHYSRADSVYAADHVGANWFKQAARSAREYLQTSPFSRQGMIEQLEFEKYTHAQAVYGAVKAGL